MNWAAKSRLALVAALLCLPGLAGAGQGAARDAYDRAERFEKAGDIRAARVEYMNAIKAAPDSIAPYVGHARTLLILVDGRGAQRSLDRAMQLGASAAILAPMRAQALLQQGRAADARDLLLGKPIDPKQAVYAARMLGEATTVLGDFDNARIALDRAIAAEPKSAANWVSVARFRLAAGDQRGAGEAVTHAVELSPKNVSALVLRGTLVRRQYGLAPSLAWFERALEEAPEDIEALSEYGATLGEVGRYTDMLATARRILQLDEDNARAMFMQATIAARGGNCDLARNILARTGDFMIQTPAALQLAGACEIEAGNPRRAAELMAVLLDRQPRNLTARLLLALGRHRAGDQPGALEAIMPIASQDGAGSYATTLAARILEAMDRREEAMAMLDRAARPTFDGLALAVADDLPAQEAAAAQRPRDAAAVLPWLRALLAHGRSGEALEAARQLAADNAGNADAQMLLGDILAEQGDRPGAWQAYQAARGVAFSRPLLDRMVLIGTGEEGDSLIGEWLAYNPTDSEVMLIAAIRAGRAGRWQATRDFGAPLIDRLGGNQPLLLSLLARADAALGDTDDALASARMAYRAQALGLASTFAYGNALLAAGRPRAAEHMLVKMAALAPDDAIARRRLAEARAAAVGTPEG